MAFTNPNKPAGLSPVRYLNGTNYTGKVNCYCILAANTNPFFQGDLVVLATGGDAGGIPAITLATAGATAVGVIVAVGTVAFGPYVNPNNLTPVNRPTGAQSVNYYAAVSDDPHIIYEIQEGGTGTNLAATTGPNKNANIVYAAPATGVNVSGTMLDNGTVATTATLNLKILRLAQRIDNHFVTSPATGGGYQKWEVLINNHQFSGGTGVAGV